MKATLIRLGIRGFNPKLKKAAERIEDLHTAEGEPIPPNTLAQPAEKSAFEQLGVEPIGLGAPVLARYGYARCVNDMGLDVARPESARQPKDHGRPRRPRSALVDFDLL